jgi:hypothetical protein
MPKATQLNLNMKNEIGALAGLCRDLAHAGVNLLALCTSEEPKELVRLLVTNRELAENALSKEGYSFAAEEY